MSELQEWISAAQKSFEQDDPIQTQLTQFVYSYLSLSSMDLEIAFWNLLSAIKAESSTFVQRFSVDTSGGLYGSGGDGNPRGSNGQSGTASTFSKMEFIPQSLAASTECMFHPDQVKMSIRDIENNYFVGDTSSLQNATESLLDLTDRLQIFDTLQSSDNLYQAFYNNEQNMFVLPTSTTIPTSVSSIRNSLATARNYISQLKLGLDFYGHGKNWVPSGSFSFYTKLLKSALSDYTKTSNLYDYYQTIAQQQQQRADQISTSLQAANSTIAQMNAEITQLDSEITLCAETISTLQADIATKHDALAAEISNLSSTIENHFDVSFSDFLDALSQMAFAPGLPMAAIQGTSILYKGFTQVTDDSGQSVNKDYLVNQFATLGQGFDGLKEALSVGTGDPTLTVDDPGATKLLGDEQNIMDLVDSYSGVLGEQAVTDLQQDFDDYVSTVLNRNNQVLRYNICVNLRAKDQAKLEDQTAMKSNLGGIAIQTLNFEIPSLAATVEQSYFEATNRVMQLLYSASKAVSFWDLSTTQPDFSIVRSPGFPSNHLGDNLFNLRQSIMQSFQQGVENFGNDAGPFGTAYGKEPMRVYLNSSQLKTLFTPPRPGSTEYGLIMNIPEVYPDTKATQSPFAGFNNVRITQVRFYIAGAQTGNGTLHVKLQHLGSETVVDQSGLGHVFTHNPLTLGFEYNLLTNGIIVDGNIALAVNDMYATPGPFATWRVSISTISNTKPQLSSATKAWFEFSGSCRQF